MTGSLSSFKIVQILEVVWYVTDRWRPVTYNFNYTVRILQYIIGSLYVTCVAAHKTTYIAPWKVVGLQLRNLQRWDGGWHEIFLYFKHVSCLTTNELVVDGIVVVKDNKGEKTREVADIRMYHFGWNFFKHVGRDMLQWWWLTSTFLYFQPVWQP